MTTAEEVRLKRLVVKYAMDHSVHSEKCCTCELCLEAADVIPPIGNQGGSEGGDLQAAKERIAELEAALRGILTVHSDLHEPDGWNRCEECDRAYRVVGKE